MPNCDDAAAFVFTGPALRVTVRRRRIEIARTGLLSRLRGGVRTIDRGRVREARVLPWGGALLLVTDDGAHTLEMGAQAEALRVAILSSPICPGDGGCIDCSLSST